LAKQGLCPAQQDTTAACQQGKVEQVYFTSNVDTVFGLAH